MALSALRKALNRVASANGQANRWGIAAAGVVIQIVLGALYAWSVFRIPLTKTFGWTISQVTLTFTIANFVLGFAAFVGGIWMRKSGPRQVAIASGILYGAGVFLASFSGGHLYWLYFSYGFLGGIGLGLGYIVPVATLVKWFPDKRGIITGIAVAGFGAGALITAPIATSLIRDVGVLKTFAALGIASFIAVTGAALFIKDPPHGFVPAGWKPSAAQNKERCARDYTFGEALEKWQWYVLWAMMFLNTLAGISIISQAAAMAQEITRVSAAVAAGMVGIIAIANGSGRILWSWLSEAIGRRAVFFSMFLIQAAAFALMPHVRGFGLFTTLAFIVLLCCGGGFGTMPAFTADYFGATHVGSIYGLMVTAWGFAAVLGPMLFASIRQNTGHYSQALYVISVTVLVSAVLPLITRPPTSETRDQITTPRAA